MSVRAMAGRCGHTRHLARLSDTRPMCHEAPVALVAAVSAGLTFLGNGQPLAPSGILSNAAGTAVYDDSEVAHGGLPARNGKGSIPPRCASRATATGARASLLPGQARDEDHPPPAVLAERPVP